MKKVIICITLVIVTACSPGPQATEGPIIDEQPTPTDIPMDLTPAQRAAITALSENLGAPVDEIKLVSTEAMDWPDSCLGVAEEGLICTEVITPGFRIILDSKGRQMEYHTNEDGTQIRPASVAITWKREGGLAGFCDYMTVFLSGEVHVSSCKQGEIIEGRLIDTLSENEMAQFDEWLTNYGNVTIDASDPKGVSDRMVVMLTFMGTGSQQTLSPSNERELVNFVQELYQRISLPIK
jgi:hypothetical protein